MKSFAVRFGIEGVRLYGPRDVRHPTHGARSARHGIDGVTALGAGA